ncbi:MAG TPA: EamA family transporter, partial [Anaerolineales bacterium]|nr:EamA family transporter [Anaerolineales bacterium]
MNLTYRQSQIETASAIALWAVSFPLIKLALREISPVTLIVIRFSLGGLSLFLIASRQRLWREVRWVELPAILGLGLVGVTLHQFLQVTGQVTASAGIAAFLASTAPAFIVLMGSMFLKERLGLLQIGGVLLATAGAAVVSTGGFSGWQKGGQLFEPGSLLILGSAVIWAVYSILNRVLGSHRPPLVTASGMMLAGVFFSLPVWINQR